MSDMIDRAAAIAALKDAGLAFGYCRAVAAIRALPAVEVGIEFPRGLAMDNIKIKPLEWVEIRPGQYFEARVIGILYSVRFGTDGIVRWQAGHMGTWHEAPTLEAAKAAAQADYAARIRSALTIAPAPDAGKVQALVEAAVAEYTLLHPVENDEERLGRHSAVRGMMVRMGLYAQFSNALAAFEKGGE